MAGRKIFVGSLPPSVDDMTLRLEFAKYGQVEDVFVKPNCDPGRQWAFVTFASPDQANMAKEACDRILTFPGADRPCDVMLAKNQGLFGQEPISDGYYGGGLPHSSAQSGPVPSRKIFVGSLPDGCSDALLRQEFSRYGTIEEIYMKPNCESGRQWAFLTFSHPEQAQTAASSANGTLHFTGAFKACEVTMARNQGMYGQNPLDSQGQPGVMQAAQHYPAYGAASSGPPSASSVGTAARKIFVGSLPDAISETVLRAEFSKYGQITDVYLKTGCETGRQWAFLTFVTPQQAQAARDSCDRKLMLAGCTRPCEVTIARNQGMFGQDPLLSQNHAASATAVPAGQPPPPATPPPPHLTPWRMYKTVSGIPYYHNHTSGVTQWECPPDLQASTWQFPAPVQYQAVQQHGVRYAPY